MTHEEFATRRQALDRQLEAGIELLRQAHQVQVRALEMVWMINPVAELPLPATAGPAQEAQPAPQAAPPAAPVPERPPTRKPWALLDDVFDALPKLGPEFVSSDVCRALGYEPNRASLQRTLQELASQGLIKRVKPGSGKVAARWAKLPLADSTGTAES